jgi:lipopolysaccharide assembly outer membrane protein LptD (OstA)
MNTASPPNAGADTPSAPGSIEKLLEGTLSSQTEGPRIGTFDSDEVEILDYGKKLRFTGNVIITTDTAEFACDEAVLDLENNTVRALGNVTMTREDGVFWADEATFDIESETGELTNCRGSFVPWLFVAPLLKRTGTTTGEIEDGYLTTCNLDRPHYRIAARRMEITDGEKIVARDATAYLGSAPILRVPRYTHSFGDDKMPFNFSAGNDRRIGYYLRTEYDFDVTERFSGTAHADIYSDEGFGTGLDGTLIPLEGGEETFQTYITTEEEGRAEVYYSQEMPRDWRGLLQLEQWSNEDFLEEFYYNEFKRRTEPETFLNLTRTRPHNIISATLRKRTNDFVEETERLPEVNVSFLERQIGPTPFYFSLENSAGYLEDKPGGESSARNYTGGRISYAGRPTNWLSVVPFAELGGTYYAKGENRNDEDLYRTSSVTGVTLGSRLHRVYDSPVGNFSAFKHIVVPTLTYAYRPDPDESNAEIHQYDAIDNVLGRSRIGFQLDNVLLSKTHDGKQRQLARLTLYSGTDLTNEQRENIDWATTFQFNPSDRLGFGFDADVHNAEEDFKRFHGRIRFRERENGGREVRLGFGYSETEEGVFNEDLSYYFGTDLGEKWRVSLEHRYDFHDDDLEYQEYRIWRDLHCFEGAISYRVRERSEGVHILIGLKAFPGARAKF